jgi:Flp pilus assembly protein TadD
MEGTSSTAVVEPKKKSQDSAAKAKRIKRLLTNPEFAEAVSEERAAVKKVHDELKILQDKYMVVMKERNEEQAKVIDSLQLKNDYIEHSF